jgi:thiamine biosynthesis lipoprotein
VTAVIAQYPATDVRIEHVMGMAVVIDVRDEIDPSATDSVVDWLHVVDARFSTYKPDSEISQIERSELAVDDAHPDVRNVLARCDQLRRATGGYFDARANGRLDPSGLVKGWAVERAVTMLERAGARSFAIYAGGDVALRGCPRPGEPWKVGIRHPRLAERVAAVVACERLAIATSAAYARGDHVVDPHTGRAADGLLSITITGPDLGTADAYATAAFAMGSKGAHWAAGLAGYEAMAMLPDDTMLTTPGFLAQRL